MKSPFKPLLIVLSLIGISSISLADSNNQAELVQQLKMMNAQMQQLEHQVSSLQGQVNTLKDKLHGQTSNVVTKSNAVPTSAKPSAASPTSTVKSTTVSASTTSQSQDAFSRDVGEKIRAALKPASQLTGNQNGNATELEKERARMALFGTAVVTGPFVNGPTFYNGSQLIVNSPSINEDLRILQVRAEGIKARAAVGLPTEMSHPRLVLSGEVVGLIQYQDPYSGGVTNDINLSKAKVDFLAEITQWVNAFMSLAYDDAPSGVSANRIDNSRVFVDTGFIMIGDLLKSPLYGSIGQLYVPFGRYSTSMITSPLTAFVGETKTRAVEIGYHPQAADTPYAETFAFHSASNNSDDRINGVGLDGGYEFALEKTTGKLGAGIISNIADSLGLQDNGLSSGFQGFAKTDGSNSENLKHNVPGGDIHAVFSLANIVFVAEYVTALKDFNTTDLTFDEHGAQPSAFDAQGTWTFHVWNRPSSFTLDYEFSREALALNIPRTEYGGSFQTTLTRDTLLTLEYLHGINYGKSSTATGYQLQAYTPSDLGKSSNTVQLQLGVYF